jgi:hypothetical protein
MGSYFTKPIKVRNISFESLERGVDTMDVNSYPSFDKSTDWAKTKHIYSEQVCFHEKYISWSIIAVLFLFLIIFLYISLSKSEINLTEVLDENIE